MSGCGKSGQGGVITGIAIVAIGILLLLTQIGILRFHAIWRLWPLVFVFFGIGKLMEGKAAAHRIWGITLLLVGTLLVANNYGHFRYDIGQLWPIFVVGAGLSLLFQSYWPGAATTRLESGGSLNGVYVFGGTERNIADVNFRGGNLFACFGGYDIDLRQSEIQGDAAVIEATAIFGGGEIHVPMHWKVVAEGVGVFGGYQDSTRYIPIEGKAPKTLVVRGAAVFGGVEVKN